MTKPTQNPRAGALGREFGEIGDAIATADLLSDQTRPRFVAITDRFLLFCLRGYQLVALDEVTPGIVRAFVTASIDGQPPSVATMHLRRSVLRFVFRRARDLGLASHDPCVDLALPPRSGLVARPLTDDEIGVCRSYSLTSLTNTRTPAAWALAETTARTAEIPHIRMCDIDLDGARVWLQGTSRTIPRWVPLSQWAITQLERRARMLDGPDVPLVYSANGSAESAQASSCQAISDTLARAGLTREPDVRPISVTAWAGRQLLEQTGHIDHVARLLGVRSLDRAARIIGWDWTAADDR